jgi:hypothetical protein
MSQLTKAINTTDTDGDVLASPKTHNHKTGKGSRQRRTDDFRKRKNAETNATIMAGVFARLKIQDPRAVATIPLSRENHPVTVPITFNKLPTYLDRVWDTMHHAEYNSMVRNCGKFLPSFYSYLSATLTRGKLLSSKQILV